jgi:hypothetical protein
LPPVRVSGQQSKEVSKIAAEHEPGAMPLGAMQSSSRVVQPRPLRLGISVTQMRAPLSAIPRPNCDRRSTVLPLGPSQGLSKAGPTRAGAPLTVADKETPPTSHALFTLNCASWMQARGRELMTFIFPLPMRSGAKICRVIQ